MKTSKSPEVTEVTPSKKKLKQARLPFKLISEVSPKPVAPPSRKRKLSAQENESVTKVGKISKENGVTEDPVVISDEDSPVEKNTSENGDKISNPLVKLVDTAIKKKQKAKSVKKRKGNKKNAKNAKVEEKRTVNSNDVADTTSDDCEVMEVDEPEELINTAEDKTNEETTQKETENTVNKPEVCDTIVLEDSNSCADVEMSNSTPEKHQENATESSNKDEVTISEELSDQESKESNIKDNDEEGKESQRNFDGENKTLEEKEIAPVTPKRSTRNKAKQEQNNNSKGSPSSSKLNDSVSSIQTTPKHTRNSSANKLDDSVTGTPPSHNLTPKQLQKKLESAKKREEREKEKQEREKKRLLEKEEKAKQKQEKDEQRKREREEKEEAKKKEKEEKEEQKRKEKEEKEKLKELEKKQKEEKDEQKRKEKEEKEEQKRKEREAREEEKRKKQEALEQEKQEQELKKKKTAEAFASYFVTKQKTEKDQPTMGSISNNMLSSFTIKSDMRLAPTTRKTLTEDKAQLLVTMIKEQNVKDGLYLESLKKGNNVPLSSGKTWPLSDKDDDDDVVLIEDELPPLDGTGEIITCEPAARENLRPKLLAFHENRRPPYWGTWRKKSKFITPRNPFGRDKKQLDYEVDSDEDWEEEQEGESIDGSAAGSDDEQGPDEYEVDNELFVPHGYLSDEEATMDEDDVLSLSPDTQKARLKHLEDEFASEMKKPTEKLKPRLYGLLWENSDGGKPDNCVDAMWNYFSKLAMILDDTTPLLQPSQETEETEKKKVKKKKAPASDADQKSPKSEKKKKVKPQKEKEGKPSNAENKKNAQDVKKNQPGINMFLTKLKST